MTADFTVQGHAPLPHLGLIRAQGADALSFLQGQLTADFLLLKPEAARLAAWCNPQGRMLASFMGWREAIDGEPSVLLVVWRDRMDAILKRLRMFVMRAKVQLSDVSDQFSLYGLLSPTDGAAPALSRNRQGDADVVQLSPTAHTARALWLAPAGQTPPESHGPLLSTDAWLLGEVLSGVAPVMSATAEAFVPQMLNYESVGGVNFKKGCYPGQEVVARSQFRGTLKQRAQVGLVQGQAQNGDSVWRLDDGEPSEVGTIALAAPQTDGSSFAAIVSLKVSALDGQLAVGSAQGPRLSLQGLPYELATDI